MRPALPDLGEIVAGKYRLVDVLGRGGMGVVFEAHHELLDRRVALKVLAPEVAGNVEAVTRFMNEARAAAKITSERVVQILDVGMLDGGLPYMVMERLEGVDLGELLTRGELQIVDAIDLLVEAIEGVSHAHLEGIIHRDLKPSNLFLATRPDRSQVVKVLDFGISKISDGTQSGSVTKTSAILGSPLYMSPEQLRSSKTIDLRADIWSLGVIAYELLTRALPFEGDNLVELFATIQARDARPLRELRLDIPPALDLVVLRCLRRTADERYSSAYALAKALVPFGGARSAASLTRLESHLSSKGRSVEELSSTLPASHSSGRAAVPTSAPAPALAMTPMTMRSDPSGRAILAPEGSSGAAGSTGASWATTGPRPASMGKKIGAIALAITAAVGGAAGVATLVMARHRAAAEIDSGAPVLATATATSRADDASSAAVDAQMVISSPDASALVPPAAGSAVTPPVTPVTAPPVHLAHPGAGAGATIRTPTGTPPPTIAPPTSTSTTAPPAPSTSPLHMQSF